MKGDLQLDLAIRRALWEGGLLGVLILDADLRLVAYNAWVALRLGEPLPQPGQEVLEAFPELPAYLLQALREVVQRGEPRVLSSAFHHPLFPLRAPRQGEVEEAYLYQTVYLLPLEEQPGVGVLIEDITGRIRHEQLLEGLLAQRTERLRAREAFLQALMHQVRRLLPRLVMSPALWTALLEGALALFEAQEGVLLLEEGEGMTRVAAWRGRFGEALVARGSWFNPLPLVREAVRRGRPFWLVEVQHTPYLPQEVARALPARTLLVLPLGVTAPPLGCLVLAYPSGYPLRTDWLEQAHLVADIWGVLLGQAALYRRLSEQQAHLEKLVQQRTTALEETFADLETLVHSLAHDLRAPLRAMAGFAQALAEDYGPQLPAEAREHIAFITRSVAQAQMLVEDLLEYGQVSRRESDLRPTALVQVIREVLSGLQDEIRRRQAVVEVREPLPELPSDPWLLYRIVFNLLENALKFVPPERTPRVVVEAETVTEPTPGIRLRVWDNGIGIAPEDQERIFRPFERLHSEERFPGSGLGLAIVQKAVQRLGGQIGVISRLGEGTCFEVWLPTERLVL